MKHTLFRAELSKAAGIWSQKNGYWSALQSLPEAVLTELQHDDLLEVEAVSGECAFFSVIRKTVKLSVGGEIIVTIMLDHPAR